MQAPQRIEPTSLSDYLEVMSRAVFQTGLSWAVIDRKWPGFIDAFTGFDPKTVAGLTPSDVDRLAEDTRIVRNRKKIEATIDNAGEIIVLDREFGGFRGYLRSHGGFEAVVKDLVKRFRFLGETGAYYFLYVVGEDVPPHEEWMAAHPARPR
jgi:3-methyladenine DNA glycosylase Tag